MIRINLLPHREQRREQRKKQFIAHAAMAGVLGAAVVFAGGMLINGRIEAQNERNNYIKGSITKLDQEIAEIQSLESDIAALQARQKAVEDLQSDRTVPVHLFDEMVRITPEGVFLNKLTQEDLKVSLSGYAQSNERVAEFLRNLSERSAWIEKPQLDEIREVSVSDLLPARAGGKAETRKVFEFSLNVLLKRRSAVVAAAAPAAVPAAAAAGPGSSLAGSLKAAAQSGITSAATSVVRPDTVERNASTDNTPAAAAPKAVSK